MRWTPSLGLQLKGITTIPHRVGENPPEQDILSEARDAGRVEEARGHEKLSFSPTLTLSLPYSVLL